MSRKWGDKFVEGNAYEINFFIVLPAKGSYRATNHAYRIVFSGKTKVVLCESNIIPNWGLSLKSSEQLRSSHSNTEYLFGICSLTILVISYS